MQRRNAMPKVICDFCGSPALLIHTQLKDGRYIDVCDLCFEYIHDADDIHPDEFEED
jgi:hypothetical protein